MERTIFITATLVGGLLIGVISSQPAGAVAGETPSRDKLIFLNI